MAVLPEIGSRNRYAQQAVERRQPYSILNEPLPSRKSSSTELSLSTHCKNPVRLPGLSSRRSPLAHLPNWLGPKPPSWGGLEFPDGGAKARAAGVAVRTPRDICLCRCRKVSAAHTGTLKRTAVPRAKQHTPPKLHSRNPRPVAAFLTYAKLLVFNVSVKKYGLPSGRRRSDR